MPTEPRRGEALLEEMGSCSGEAWPWRKGPPGLGTRAEGERGIAEAEGGGGVGSGGGVVAAGGAGSTGDGEEVGKAAGAHTET